MQQLEDVPHQTHQTGFSVPSGGYFAARDFALMRALAQVESVMWSDKPFKLKSGILSHVYVREREDLTDNPAVLALLADLLCDKICRDKWDDRDDRQACLIGVPDAATPIATAASIRSLDPQVRRLCRNAVAHRVMRKVKKDHGEGGSAWVVGKPDTKRHRYAVVENVTTSGKSVLEVIERLEEDGYPTREMEYYILVDRGQGAIKKLTDAGYRIKVLYHLLDIVSAFVHLNLWKPEQMQSVKAEIETHQFA